MKEGLNDEEIGSISKNIEKKEYYFFILLLILAVSVNLPLFEFEYTQLLKDEIEIMLLIPAVRVMIKRKGSNRSEQESLDFVASIFTRAIIAFLLFPLRLQFSYLREPISSLFEFVVVTFFIIWPIYQSNDELLNNSKK